MCAVSMIMDHFHDKWFERRSDPPQLFPNPAMPNDPQYIPLPYPVPGPPAITQEEIDEFRKLLERAREYDRKNNQAECELQEKRERLLKLAEELGMQIEFV